MSTAQDAEFGKLRSFFWPIHAKECWKLIPMLLISFFICLNYSLLRNMKDSVVITASGAEVIPFIKVWTLLPGAILITLLYAKLTSIFSQEKVFYLMISSFLIFFGLFAFVIYPNTEQLHAHTVADFLDSFLPMGFKGFTGMIRYWSFTAFYVISELWGSMVLSVIFWGFANEITRLGEARRFYSVMGIFSNIATMVAGTLGSYFAANSADWQQTFSSLMLFVIGSGILAMALFRWMSTNVLNSEEYDDLRHNTKEFKRKKKMSVRESFNHLSNSKYLVCTAIMVVAYNLGINLVEVVWKDQLKLLYPSTSDYNSYMSSLTFWMGLISTILAFFVSTIIARFGWTVAALVTPITMLVTSVGFFAFIFFEKYNTEFILAITGISPLAIAVFFGGAQNGLSKAAKYSIFDATKEMTFIPLSHEWKIKGKAAIDGVGSRLGKSGGSIIHQSLLIMLHSVVASAGYVAAIFLVTTGFWISATRKLGKEFDKLVDEQSAAVSEQEKAKETSFETVVA